MPLPNILEFIGTNVTQAGFKVAQEKLLNFLSGEAATKVELSAAVTPKADKTYVDTALASFQNGAIKTYSTLTAANADIANIALNTKVSVLSAENGGDYYKASASATSLTKSAYDSLTQAKSFFKTTTKGTLTKVEPNFTTGFFYNISAKARVSTTDMGYQHAYIRVNPQDIVVLEANIRGNTSLVRAIVFVDLSGNILESYGVPTSGTVDKTVSLDLIAPANTVGAHITIYTTTGFSLSTSIYKNVLAQDNFDDASNANSQLDMLSTDKLTNGYYWRYENGICTKTATVDKNYYALNRVKVTPGESYRLISKARGNSAIVKLVTFTDALNQIVGYHYNPISESVNESLDTTFTVPANAVFMCITTASSNLICYKINGFVQKIAENILELSGQDDLTTVSTTINNPYYWNYTNGIMTNIADTEYNALSAISVSEGDIYRLTCDAVKGNPSIVKVVMYKNSSGNVIGYEESIAIERDTPVALDTTFTVPANAATMHISLASPTHTLTKLPKGLAHIIDERIEKELESYTAIDENIVNMFDYWKGKKVLWIGTSVPAASSSYAYKLADRLGFRLVNKSVGWSPIRGGVAENISTDDPYGWKNSQYQRVVKAMSQSKAIKQSFIDNYAKWQPLLKNAPSALTEAEKALILSYSYENIFAGNLDADLIVIDHGVNDREWLLDLGLSVDLMKSGAVSTRDINYFYGGMNTILDHIFNNNVYAKVAMIGFFENTLRPELCEVQQDIAQLWQIPFCKTWEKTRFSQQKLSTGKTVLATIMSDSLHPHNDPTGKAHLLLTDILESFMRDVR